MFVSKKEGREEGKEREAYKRGNIHKGS